MILLKLSLFLNVMIAVTLISGIGAFILLLKAWKDGKSDKEIVDDVDKILKIYALRNKLDKIENERSQTKKKSDEKRNVNTRINVCLNRVFISP